MIGVAIIGTGMISERHVKAYKLFGERCKILALCDIAPERAQELADRFELKDITIYTDYQEMLSRDDIQLVSICTPPITHAPTAKACMLAGKHVLTEKPMASSLEECDEMLKVKEETGCYLGVIAQNRYTQGNTDLKKMIRDEAAGKVRSGLIRSYWYRGHEYYDMWWRGTWEREGGGCTLNHAVHQIDLLNWIMGAPKTVTAVLGNVAHDNSESEDVGTAVFTYENGAMITLVISLVTHGEGQSLSFFCDKADLSSPWQASSSRALPTGFPEPNHEGVQAMEDIHDKLPALEYIEHAGQINDVLSCIEQGSDLETSTGIDGRLSMEVIAGIYQSAFTGTCVSFPLPKDAPFYTRDGILANAKRFN